MRPRRRIILLSVLTVPALILTGCLKSFDPPARLHVTGLDLKAEEVRAQSLLLNVTTLLDNRGEGPTGELSLELKAYDETTGFLVATNHTDAAPVPGETSAALPQHVTLPREGAVRLEVHVYEDGERIQRAGVTARNLAALKPDAHDTGLKISDMDFLVKSADDGKPVIRCDFYFANEADAESEDLKVQVKAREVATGLVADTAWLQTTEIPAGKTRIRTVNLTVPDGYNYVIEILTWRDEVIVDRATGHVQLAPTFEKPKDQEVILTNVNLQDFTTGRSYSGKVNDYAMEAGAPGAAFPMYGSGEGDYAREAPAAAVPAPGALAAFAAVAGVALLVRGGWRRG